MHREYLSGIHENFRESAHPKIPGFFWKFQILILLEFDSSVSRKGVKVIIFEFNFQTLVNCKTVSSIGLQYEYNCPQRSFRYDAHYVTAGWWRGTVVERRSLAGELSLSCARPAADG